MYVYFVYFFYCINDYTLCVIFVFIFMGGSISAVMLLLCYLPITIIIIILPVVLYSTYNNCISNILVVISYMNHVSQ